MAAVLADFHAWLTALSAPAEEETPPPARTASVDLHTLLGQFLAVRQEVNLQTRAVRAQQEQNAETLRQLAAALDALRQSQARAEQERQQVEEQASRPLLKTLVDLYDALALAGRETQRLRETFEPALEPLTSAGSAEAEPLPSPAPPSFWARWFGPSAPDAAEIERRAAQRQDQLQARHEREARVRQTLASLVTGYTMSLQRVERALRQHGLEAIPTMGQRFDPERMEVLEAVADSGRPAGEVIEEVRRGYLWSGRVFRYAQVRVAKG